MTTLNRNHHHYMIAPPTSSEINQSKVEQSIGNFGCRADDVPPFLMNQSVVRLAPSYEVNHSVSQQTTVTTLSRDNSGKKLKHPSFVNEFLSQKNEATDDSFTDKLMKCTQKVLIFKNEANESSTVNEKPRVMKKTSSGSIGSGNTISNSSLKEIDEEEYISSDIVHMNHSLANDFLCSPGETSWLATTTVWGFTLWKYKNIPSIHQTLIFSTEECLKWSRWRSVNKS